MFPSPITLSDSTAVLQKYSPILVKIVSSCSQIQSKLKYLKENISVKFLYVEFHKNHFNCSVVVACGYKDRSMEKLNLEQLSFRTLRYCFVVFIILSISV
jgi:hypothetical protein